jgi:glycosyltransferase involved in cell wall biosynthesis
MKIAVVAPPWIPVPPVDYGGTELIVDILCRGYQDHGHSVTLFCSAESTCPVERRSTIQRGYLPPDKYQEHRHFGFALDELRQEKFDIVHAHLEGFIAYAPLLDIPLVCTVHVPVIRHREPLLADIRSRTIAISSDHASSFPRNVQFIYNGIEFDRYQSEARPGDHLIWIGAIKPEKGIERSLKLARSSNSRLVIAGRVDARYEQWFDELLSNYEEHAFFIGPVGFQDKVDLLSSAKALLMPVNWREPFGLIAIEAMACNTPVIATPNGALPEIISSGVNGFLCETDEEFVSAINAVNDLDGERVRATSKKRFSAERMVSEYLELLKDSLD